MIDSGAQAPTGDRARAVWAGRHRRIRLRPPAEPAITPAPVHDEPTWWAQFWAAMAGEWPIQTNTARSIR